MMRRAVALVILPMLAACATPDLDERIDPRSDPPPSFAELQAEIDAEPPCVSDHETRRAGETPYVRSIRLCPAHFPKILQVVSIGGACRSMFDVDDAGIPINIEARCDVTRYGGLHKSGWTPVASQALVYATRKAVSQHRYLPSDDPAAAGKWRTNLSQGMRFEFRGYGSVANPAVFDRPPPAVPLTTEQLAILDPDSANLSNQTER
jgi:hypothetical protein